ncbi:anaphase-promoting complex, cyclosome, subunit 4-domain-containing protein [Boeremia exigua]|uniref:anaphase-promoting complex, cyclosome, subunit 4-domain-containing protein n=1 Tax=Boeremia exigua TaxID=749465 RepID=UPI001E8E05F3|nr:anaphase-promoting complex, cyclosome, subunit 4-domain-containing protein [Boeremia exigua]KAH6644580.1 anaphase-promoting complex, cyclosome, subunit 4-domain-containing protein [Boeremia exigua]
MESSDAPTLLQQAEKILLHPIHPHLIAYCPTMDLVAVVTTEENLDVYRINGQRAFGLKRKSEGLVVDTIKWEFNGKSIAVSWSDGKTDLVSSETGKVGLKDLGLPESASENGNGGGGRVKCIGWGLNFIDVDTVKARTKKVVRGFDLSTDTWDDAKDGTDVEDFLQRQPDLQALDCAPDLPDQLAVVDVETLLPKLPAIPLPPMLPFMRLSQTDSGAFGSQAEVDALLHSHHLKDYNSVDMFIRCSERGTIHPSIYDSVETVTVSLPSHWDIHSAPLIHASHPYACSHGLLMRTTTPSSQTKNISFVPLTLNFIPSAGIYLHLIASKTSQLQNLLLYITQCLQRIRTFYKHATDLPAKFMMNISETLEEKSQGDLTTSLFHLACTGACPPLIREWLVDELSEQGHKRWDNTVTSSLATLQALVHENLIPALDRAAIVISRLRGLAMYHDTDWIFSNPATEFTSLLETLKNMRLLAHTVLVYVADEKRQFAAFSRWMRFVIDFETTEPDSESRAEMESRDSGVDINLVLEYVRHGLQQSSLHPYLMPDVMLEAGDKARERASYEDTKKAISVFEDGARWRPEALCLENVLGHMARGTTGLLRQVSKWQESGIQMDSGIILETLQDAEGDVIADMRMVHEQVTPSQAQGSTGISTYIAIASTSSPVTLDIHRLTHSSSITTLPRDLHSHSIANLSFPPGTSILDAKFADDAALLVLMNCTSPKRSNDTDDILGHRILRIPYNTTPQNKSPALTYHTLSAAENTQHLLPKGSAPAASGRVLTKLTPAVVQQYTIHVFERGGRFTPDRLVVNGRKGRRVVVVLAKDGKHYRVLDMDYPSQWEEEGDDTEVGIGEDGDTVMSGL